MNNIIIGFVLCLTFTLQSVFANEFENDGYEPGCEPCQNWEVVLRGAAVFPASQKFRKIYSDVEPEIQYELARRIYTQVYAWANAGWLWDRGHSTGINRKTNIDFYSVSFGLKYEFDVRCDMKAYFGAGAATGFLKIKNHDDHVKKHFHENSWGGILKSGIHYSFTDNLYLDLFADYLFLTFSKRRDLPHNKSHSVNMGGLRLGGGIGIKF